MTTGSETKRPSRGRRAAIAIASMLAGLGLGLAGAEAAFHARDDGAFPHLNCFVADAALGVTLEPGCETRVSFSGNPVSDVRIAASGRRGPDAPAREDDILVVGDSQAFGLGVSDGETFAARLAEIVGRPVHNGGVPTYGPLEYTAVVRRALEGPAPPRTIVYAINMANDFFEHSRPNRERHAVWDHWAVRVETAPADTASFPGRDWLYRRSHAFYALRRYLHETDDTIDALRDQGFASEGTLTDLVHGGDEAAHLHEEAERAHRAALEAQRARIAALTSDLARTESDVDREVFERESAQIWAAIDDADLVWHAARGHVGDIVEDDDGESSRGVMVTAALLNQAMRLRRRMTEAAMRARDGAEVRALVEARERIAGELEAERARGVDDGVVPSVLEKRLEELRELARAHDAEVIVVALPLDVTVSELEFAKYGAEPVDMSAARTLLGDLVASAERLGMRAVDVSEALAAIEPGAFLDGDLHLSPSGHRAVAEAIAARLAEPAPLPRPAPGLPEGRSAVPQPDDFVHADEVRVTGSSAARCATHLVREWLRVSCRAQPRRHAPTGARVISGGGGEAMVITTEEAATLIVPVQRGADDVVADFTWATRTQRLTVSWPASADAPAMSFGEASAAPSEAPPAVSAEAARLCECHREVYRMGNCEGVDLDEEYRCPRSCIELYGEVRAECHAAFATSCGDLLRCARGDPQARAECPPGSVHALATGRCLAPCAPDVASTCEGGACTPWRGAHVCVR